MKIEGIFPRKIYAAKAAAAPKASGVGSAPAVGRGADSISISAAGAKSMEMTKAVQDIAREAVQETSPQKIARLKEAVQTGEYSVSAQAVADAILRSVLGE